jgi:hypothetical protein
MNNILLLNSTIYDERAIKVCVESYRDVVDIEITKTEGYFNAKFLNPRYDLITTMQEFENYLIQILASGKIDYDSP